MTTFGNPDIYFTMRITSDWLFAYFTAYIGAGDTPLIWKLDISSSSGTWLKDFDSSKLSE